MLDMAEDECCSEMGQFCNSSHSSPNICLLRLVSILLILLDSAMAPRTFDERLRYHAQRFQGKPPQDVLKRYEQSLHMSLKSDELQKHAFHVAAWVAELPAEQMASQYNGLSAVVLLQNFLRVLKDAESICDHLVRVLTKVWERIQSHSDLELQWPGLLKELGHVVPDKAAKAAKLMNKAILVWRNTTCETKQEEYVASLERSLHDADDDLCRIRFIFRRAVAALSPPHGANQFGTFAGSPQPRGGKRDFQVRLRTIVLRCLNYLELDDSKVQPALQFLKSLLRQEFDSADRSRKVACEKQWRLLRVKCGLSSDVGAEVDVAPASKRRVLCPHSKRRDMCRICTPCPHGKLKSYCEKCKPCPHGKYKRNCRKCSSCEHGKTHRNCPFCAGCVHGRNKYKCKICRQDRGNKLVAPGKEKWCKGWQALERVSLRIDKGYLEFKS